MPPPDPNAENDPREQARDAAGEILRPEPSVTRDIDAALVDAHVGRIVGPYKLLEKIGEGGFGVVFVAEQREPVKRRVALKIIKAGMDTREVIARFESERQALAMMDHPNIARVFDAGTTEAGRPYFAMELVRGIPITDYCDQHRLSTRERLLLCLHVCQAVQHAHQKGIIHRDLKPSNILVTLHDGVPVPKVIDFGIAKSTQQELTDKTVYTQLHQFLGTPAYMSPEQAEMSGFDVDTRSDIYSLGVLLYEILTGRTPFDGQDLLKRGLDEMVRTIREVEPPRPSTRLSGFTAEERGTAARRRNAEPARLARLLRGDLDWVVMKCLEKDRTRRYETAYALAADLQRHLAQEPVAARPPSAGYRLQKWVRRNRLAALATTAVLLALLGGLAFSTAALLRERRARMREAQAEQARRQASVRATSVGKFLEDLMSGVVPVLLDSGGQTAARELLQTLSEIASQTLTNSPATELRLQYRIVRTYANTLREPGEEARQWQHVAELMGRVQVEELPDTLEKMKIFIAASQLERDVAPLHRLEEEYRRRTPPELFWVARCLYEEGRWLYWSGRNDEAVTKLAEAYRILPRGVQRSLDCVVTEQYDCALGAAGKWSNSLAVAQSALLPWREPSGALLEEKLLERKEALVSDIVRAHCAMGAFDAALAFLRAQELELQAAAPSSEYLNQLRMLEVQALAQGRRVPEALALITNLHTNEGFTGLDCALAGALALAANDLPAYRGWCATAINRFTSGEDGPGAWSIARLLLAQPQSPAVLHAASELVQRVEHARDYLAARAPALRAWVEFRQGHPAAALAAFHRQPTNFTGVYVLGRAVQWDPLAIDWGFQTAMAALQAGQTAEATQAFRAGLAALDGPGASTGRKRIDLGDFCLDWYLQNAVRTEAETLFREKGLPVPGH